MSKTCMIFGLGDLGQWVLEFMARSPGVNTIITCDTREDWGYTKTECAAIGAGQQGYNKTIRFEKCDVYDIDATAELLQKYNPDVIYSGLALLGWVRATPPDIDLKVNRSVACITPHQVVLISKLMQARKRAGITCPVLNNSYPDVTNPILWRNGLGPAMGGGNIDLTVGEVRRKISLAENVPMSDVTVYLVAPHAVATQGTRTGIPYFFKVLVGDRDITGKVDVDSLISDSILMDSPTALTSWLNLPTIAASAVRDLMAIINDTNELAHVPGPNGLPGGYPVRVSAKGVDLALPEGMSQEEAVKINLAGLKNDGVEEIKDDGTLVLTDEAVSIQKEFYEGFDLKEYRFADMEAIAKELLPRFRKFVAKYN